MNPFWDRITLLTHIQMNVPFTVRQTINQSTIHAPFCGMPSCGTNFRLYYKDLQFIRIILFINNLNYKKIYKSVYLLHK